MHSRSNYNTEYRMMFSTHWATPRGNILSLYQDKMPCCIAFWYNLQLKGNKDNNFNLHSCLGNRKRRRVGKCTLTQLPKNAFLCTSLPMILNVSIDHS